MTDLIRTLKLNSFFNIFHRLWYICVEFNNSFRANKISRASKLGRCLSLSEPCKPGLQDLSKPTPLILFLSFSSKMLVLLKLKVGHLAKKFGHIKSVKWHCLIYSWVKLKIGLFTNLLLISGLLVTIEINKIRNFAIGAFNKSIWRWIYETTDVLQ